MKKLKIFGGVFVVLALLVSSLALTAQAAPGWDTTGNYVLNMEYLGTQYPHDVSLTQNAGGSLTGGGGSPAGANVYTWVVTSGTVSGNAIDFFANYTATADAVVPQTVLHVVGTIATNGTISGTWSDNYQGGSRSGALTTVSGSADSLGTLSAEDFGVVSYDVGGGLGMLKGYTAGFGLADNTFAGATSVVVKLYTAGDVLLQTNTAILSKFNADITGTQFSSPFDVSGTFNYAADGYWTNVRESQYGQSVSATKVVATVTLENGRIVTATNTNLTGNPTTIYPPANTAPVISNVPASPVSIPELSLYTFDANATDSDTPAQTLTFSLSGAPAGASINFSTGGFTWTPTEAQGSGSYTFDVRVSDGSLMDSESITINVTEVSDTNVAPVLGAITTPRTIPELSHHSFDVDATDANSGDTLIFSLSGAPSGATIGASNGTFHWKPTETQGPGTYSFDVIVSDGSLTDSQSVTIHVTEVDNNLEDKKDKDECKKGGWMNFINPSFKNQGQCVSFMNHKNHGGEEDEDNDNDDEEEVHGNSHANGHGVNAKIHLSFHDDDND